MTSPSFREWVRNAPPGTLILASAVAAELDAESARPEPGGGAGESEYLSTDRWAKLKLGGARTAKTVARWCREGLIPGALQLPDGSWLVPTHVDPPIGTRHTRKPQPPARSRTGGSLRDVVRRKANNRK